MTAWVAISVFWALNFWEISAKYYPGRGCGLTTKFRFFESEPADKTLLKCAFVGEHIKIAKRMADTGMALSDKQVRCSKLALKK